MRYEYRITYNPHFDWCGTYFGERYFPQRRWKLWFFTGDWQDMKKGYWGTPRGWPTLKQAQSHIADMKKTDTSVEVVL